MGTQMRYSVRLALVAALAASMALPADASAILDPASYLLSKAAWAAMDWQKPEDSPLWRSLAWTVSGDGTVSQATVTIFGTPFKALWMGGVLHIIATDAFPSCDGLEPKTTVQFGEPLADDGSVVIPFSETRSMKMVAMFYQWDVGNTRILASCVDPTSSPTDPNKLTWELTFAPPRKLPKLMPKFALRCTRTVTYGDGTTHDATDVAMWVDPYMKNVTNADGVEIADKGTFVATDSQLRFTATRGGVRSDYTIDRITGSLSATVLQNDQQAGTIGGKCEKASSLGAKF